MLTSINGIALDVEDIRELIRQCKHYNIFPIFLDHVLHDKRPKKVFDVLSGIVHEHISFLDCLNSDELNAEAAALPAQVREMVGCYSSGSKTDYLKRFSLYWIAVCMESEYYDLRSSLKRIDESSVVGKKFPELLSKIDDDGLLFLDDEFRLLDGGIEYREHILHYHQLLRRGFLSEPNFAFTSRFSFYRRKTEGRNLFRIAIDPRRIMTRSSYQQKCELDGWYGALFRSDKIDDLSEVGLTVINRERPSLFDMDCKIDRTEFFWKSDRKTGVKTFEIEEISSGAIRHNEMHLNRYIHSERDTAKHVLRHFDGAVKVYSTESEYDLRHKSKIPQEGRASEKIKLFRIDGSVDLEEWSNLISLFMKGNEMVIRYFDPDSYETQFREVLDRCKLKML